ncbi:MAG: hypothetical protein M3Z66_24035 [Chloroflexota bacterium]|nr:hypothetical protein [Chloroflexota bacterium]
MRLFQRSFSLPFLALLAGIIMTIPVLILGLPALRAQSAGSGPAATAGDPHLVLHPQTAGLRTVLSGGIIVTGAIAPTIPGENTVRLVVHGHSRTPQDSPPITLTVTMLDMKMEPLRTELVPKAHGYIGVLKLPMFGRYRVSLTMVTPEGIEHGVFTIELPLPHL